MLANVDEYLAHIGYTGSKEPTLANLDALHSCHLFSIVFENMSCIIGEKVQLDHDWIFEKIIKRGRGGFCFELNGMFHWLLKSLGYDVRMVSAAVAAPRLPTGFSFPTDHLMNLVKVENRQFLCDVGFGKHTFTTPIPLEVGVHSSLHGLHRVIGEKGGAVDVQKWDGGAWSTKCRVDIVTKRVFSDFETQCHYHQEPTAYMFGNSIAAKYLPGGELITMLGFSFRHYRFGESGEQELVESKDDLPANEVNQLLRERFLLTLTEGIVPRRFDTSQFNV